MIYSLKVYSSMVFSCAMVSTIKFGPLSSPQKVTALPSAELPISLCSPLSVSAELPDPGRSIQTEADNMGSLVTGSFRLAQCFQGHSCRTANQYIALSRAEKESIIWTDHMVPWLMLFGLCPLFDHCEQHCCEHRRTSFCVDVRFRFSCVYA